MQSNYHSSEDETVPLDNSHSRGEYVAVSATETSTAETNDEYFQPALKFNSLLLRLVKVLET